LKNDHIYAFELRDDDEDDDDALCRALDFCHGV
jgi:hypothetical protein